MLNVMGVNDLRQVNSQQDAAQCIQTFLCATSQTNFLWHFTEEKLQCDGCVTTATSITPNSVAAIDISHFLRNGYIMASDAIQRHFTASESNIERNCANCHGTTCSKSVALPQPPSFILVQFKRFKTTTVRTTRTRFLTTTNKITNEAIPFSSLQVQTHQGTFLYKVIATVQHIGQNISQGHYISYILRNNVWLCCDDERITPLGADTNEPTRHAYLVLLQLLP